MAKKNNKNTNSSSKDSPSSSQETESVSEVSMAADGAATVTQASEAPSVVDSAVDGDPVQDLDSLKARNAELEEEVKQLRLQESSLFRCSNDRSEVLISLFMLACSLPLSPKN
jgi:uncharacterized protein YlxW (UPF0749 family)